MKRLLLSAAATCLVLSPLACDFGRTGNQILAQKVMVGTLFSTPDVDISPLALAGQDGGTLPDGGIPDGGNLTLPGQTVAFVFFGTRESQSGIPEPLSNASVRIDIQNGGSVPLKNDGLGSYSQSSDFGGDGGVKYQSGATYRFVAQQEGATHVGVVEEAPALERIDALHPASGFRQHPRGQPLTLQRPPVSGGRERTLGFVTVFPISEGGNKGQPTYTTLPTDPVAILQIAVTPLQWQQATIEIPGTAFPEARSNYLVVFQTVKSGGAESDNLFIGSSLLVGTADVGLVRTP